MWINSMIKEKKYNPRSFMNKAQHSGSYLIMFYSRAVTFVLEIRKLKFII